jgi:hypothetical protein
MLSGAPRSYFHLDVTTEGNAETETGLLRASFGPRDMPVDVRRRIAAHVLAALDDKTIGERLAGAAGRAHGRLHVHRRAQGAIAQVAHNKT